jgi:SSS family solute:Na+ symporter
MTPRAYGTTVDYLVIVAYLVVIFGLGTRLARYNRSTRDFFVGGQRFGWWVIAVSLVATTVGSYSFVKYAAMAYQHGLSASMSYLNDWFWMPLFMFTWLPIIYYGRVYSVPEYFERRFDRRARNMATVILLLYMVGYIGINLLTMGKVAAQLLGYEQTLGPVFVSATIVAIICGIYVASGGQAAVILSDLIQGLLLLGAGLWLFALGLSAIGGFDLLWSGLSPIQKTPLSPFNDPPSFNFIGVFWQDAVTQGMVIYFLNQGHMLRFLSGRSVDTGRTAAAVLLLVLQILAALAVANAGWIGRAMVTHGMIEPGSKPDEIFMVVSHLLTEALGQPGVFGFVLAALTAALMSTADTLINACASVWVNDVWKPYVRPQASDRHHLLVGRIASMAAAGIGILMVPVYFKVGTIYQAHGAFTAAVGPPMAVAAMLGLFWKRFTPTAAFWTMLGGLLFILLSFPLPQLVEPLAMGVRMALTADGEPNLWKAYSFQRALFGLLVSAVIAVLVSLFTRPKPAGELVGLVAGTQRRAREQFKGSTRVNETAGPKIRASVRAMERGEVQTVLAGTPQEFTRWIVFATPAMLTRLEAEPGDLVGISDARFFFSDLRGGQGMLAPPPPGVLLDDGVLGIPAEMLDEAQLDRNRQVTARRVL